MTVDETIECRTCGLLARRDAGLAPPWDSILRTEHWDVVHCDATTVKGWLVLVVRRHVPTVAELTDEEVAVLGVVLRDVSRALHAVVGCDKTYVVQFAESPLHRHVHFHVIPRDPALAPEHRGPGIFQLLGVPEDLRVPEAEMNDFARGLRHELGLAPASG